MGKPAQVLLGALVLSVSAEGWAAGQADTQGLSYQRLSCVPAGGNAKVSANLPDGFSSASVRLYFRASTARDDHFVEMRRSGRDGYWAVLPAPSLQTPSVTYRVVARDGDGRVLSTEPAQAPVVASCPVTLADDEARAARNLVVGLTNRSQYPVPPGFGCKGIVARITADGELSAYSACAEVTRAATLARVTPTPCPGCGTLGIGGVQPVIVEPVCQGCGTPVIGGTGGFEFPTPPPPPPPPSPTPTPTLPPVSGFRPSSSR